MFVNWIYTLVLDIFCQQLGDICQLEGVCLGQSACFGAGRYIKMASPTKWKPIFGENPEGAMHRASRVHPGYPFLIWLLGFLSKKRDSGVLAKRPKASGWNSIAGLFMQKSGNLQKEKNSVAFRSFVRQGRSENAILAATQKPQMKMGPTLIDYWSIMWDEKNGPLLGAQEVLRGLRGARFGPNWPATVWSDSW